VETDAVEGKPTQKLSFSFKSKSDPGPKLLN
jgi:hypothetical protein